MWNWFGISEVGSYNGLNIRSLPLNRAYVIAKSMFDNVSVYTVREDCFRCPYKLATTLRANQDVTWEVDTSDEILLKVMNLPSYEYIAHDYTGGLICQQNFTFGEHGVYRLDASSCEIHNVVPPVQPYLPLLPCIVIVYTVYSIYASVSWMIECIKKLRKKNKVVKNIEEEIKSLNIFRGILMVVVIFTTSGGGDYPILSKKIGGVSIPDVAFSALAWTTGVHIPYDVDTDLASGKNKCAVAWNIVQKSILLIFSSWVTDSTRMKKISSNALWSPLKRVGFAYLVVAFAYALTATRRKVKDKVEDDLSSVESGDSQSAQSDSEDKSNNEESINENESETESENGKNTEKLNKEHNKDEEETETIEMTDVIASSDEETTIERSPSLTQMFLKTIRMLMWGWIFFGLVFATLIGVTNVFVDLSCTLKTGFKEPKMNYSNVESDVKIRCGYWLTKWFRMALAGEASFVADVEKYLAYNTGILGTLSTILITMIGLKTGVIFVHFKSHAARLKLWAIWATVLLVIGVPLIFIMRPFASIFLLTSTSMYILIAIYAFTDIGKWDILSLEALGLHYLSILFAHLLFSNAYPFTFYELNNHLWSLLQDCWTTSLWLFKGEYLVNKYMKISESIMLQKVSKVK